MRIPCMYNLYGDQGPLSTLPLDPIVVAGKFTVGDRRSRPFSTAYGLFVSEILQSEEEFKRSVLLPPVVSAEIKAGRETKSVYRQHLTQLCRAGVIEECTSGQAKVLNSYFAVGKDETVSRAIFNGIPISSACRVPPSVRLLEPCEIVRYYRELEGRIAIGVLDIRHWFHQISLDGSLFKFFALRFGDQYFRWKVLPMGFSWSPFVAQCLGWSLIIEALISIKVSFPSTVLTELPYYIPYSTSKGHGRIFLTYDNVTVMGNSGQEDAILHGIIATLKSRNIAIKGSEAFHPKMLLFRDEEGDFHECANVGICFARNTKSKMIRIASKTNRKWTLAQAEITLVRQPTRRQVSRIIGILIADTRVRLLPLISIAESIQLLRVDTELGWDRPSSITEKEWMALKLQLSKIIRNEWSILDRDCRSFGPTILIAADASKDHAGYVVFDGNTEEGIRIIVEHDFDVPASLHIYTKELIAARSALRYVSRTFPGSRVILLEDNTAAAQAIRNLYTLSESGMEIILEIAELLSSSSISLNVIGVRSAENPADALSRRGTTPLPKLRPYLRLLEDSSAPPWSIDKEISLKFGGPRHTDDEEEDLQELLASDAAIE